METCLHKNKNEISTIVDIFKMMKDGYTLGVAKDGCCFNFARLQKGGLRNKSEVFVLKHETFDFLVKEKYIQFVEQVEKDDIYELTEKGLKYSK